MGGGLGGPAQAGKPDAGSYPAECAYQIRAYPVPTGGYHADRIQLPGNNFGQHLQPARHEVQHRDTVPPDQRCPPVRVAAIGLVDDDERRAGAPRAEDVEHRQIALQRGQCQHPVARSDLEVGVHEFDGVHRRSVGDLDALGCPGRPGGEQNVGQFVGIDCGGLGFSRIRQAGPDGVGHRQRRHRLRQRLRAAHQTQPHPGGLQDPPGPVAGLIDADGQVGGTRGVDPEQRRNLFGRLGTQHRDHIAGAHPALAQCRGHGQHLGTQLGVRQVTLAAVHRGGVGSARSGSEEPVVQRI